MTPRPRAALEAASAILALSLGLLPCPRAQAQRTVPGQGAVSLELRHAFPGPGVGAAFCPYTRGGAWDFGAECSLHYAPASIGGSIPYADILARAGHQWRLASTRSRSLGLYAGGGVLLGAEAPDPFAQVHPSVSTGLPECSFLYGAYACATLEAMLSTRLALTASATLQANFSSPLERVHAFAGAGLKILL